MQVAMQLAMTVSFTEFRNAQNRSRSDATRPWIPTFGLISCLAGARTYALLVQSH
jgi:hypothetical protein